MSDEITVIAIVEAKPGEEAAAEAAIRACVEETRKEPECRLYTAHVDISAPGRFVFVERWANRAALDAHEQQPHFLAMVRVFESVLTGPIKAFLLRTLPEA
jgi:quinol monooxygenase YgiN